MYNVGLYKKDDEMGALICENYAMLLILSIFDIPIGFGEKTVEAVCEERGVDTETFLAIVNLFVNEECPSEEVKGRLSVPALTDFLRRSHVYFLEYRLPAIRRKLVEIMQGELLGGDSPADGTAVGSDSRDIARLMMRFYDEYVDEVRKHMNYEDEVVFPYVETLLSAKGRPVGYEIAVFSKHHDHVENKLTEFKNLIIKYYPARSSVKINSLLYDIFNCASDLRLHNAVENELYVPAIQIQESMRNPKR
ncbi:MAG: hemerythrin domain-containing protein [Bacteroidales bacterium]|nr:hemerythrin domain-containing protein [Bacteroidales bacterium]